MTDLDGKTSVHTFIRSSRQKAQNLTQPSNRHSRNSMRISNLQDMTIREDAVLEALCEKTNIETRTSVRNRAISVTKKERKHIFNKFASSTEIG